MRRSENLHPLLRLAPLAAGLALAACSTPDGPAAWRIEPVYSAGAGSQASVGQGYAALARVYEAEGRWQAALDAWRKAVAADPANADLHTSAGVALARGSQLEQAIEQFHAAVALQPDNARALNNLGYALALDGRDEQAAAVLGQALAVDSSHAAARANLATVEQRLALRLAPELIHGAVPSAVAALAAAPAAPAAEVAPADDVPDKVMAMLLGKVPASSLMPVSVQTASNVAALSVVNDAAATMPLVQGADASEPMTLILSAEPTISAALQVSDQPVDPGAAATEPAARPAAARADARISIVNGVGVSGAAARVRRLLQEDGLAVARLQNLLPYNQATTVVQYRPGRAELAHRIAQRIPAGAATQEVSAMDAATDLRVVLGQDRKPMLAACVARQECAAPATHQAERLAVVADAAAR